MNKTAQSWREAGRGVSKLQYHAIANQCAVKDLLALANTHPRLKDWGAALGPSWLPGISVRSPPPSPVSVRQGGNIGLLKKDVCASMPGTRPDLG